MNVLSWCVGFVAGCFIGEAIVRAWESWLAWRRLRAALRAEREARARRAADALQIRKVLDVACRPWDETRKAHKVSIDGIFGPNEDDAGGELGQRRQRRAAWRRSWRKWRRGGVDA